MDLIEIGAVLRAARERKGLSIEAVEEKIKIAPSVIVALEEGNRSRFPHPVYARGFVRSYSTLLDLDAAEICLHFSRAYPVPTEADHPEMHAPRIKVKSHDPGHLISAVRIVAVLGIFVLGIGGWYAFDVYRGRQTKVVEPVAEQPRAIPETSAPAESASDLPAPITQMQEVAAASDPGVQNSSNATVGSPKPSDPAAQTVETPGPQQTAPGNERVLIVTAHAASWLQARADDKVVDYFLRKGESTSIAFTKTLSVKFGNAGGVKLELDGNPYPFEAKPGEVKTLVVE